MKRMPSKGRYTAGKQVSRWEADSENIDIEYKNLESQTHANICPNCSCLQGDKKNLVIKLLFVTVVFGVGLVLGYLVRKTVLKNKDIPLIVSSSGLENKSDIYRIRQDYDPDFSKLIQADLEDVINYDDHLKTITKCVHMSGVGSANKVLTYVQEKWETFPFSAVKVKKYNVTLSYANYTNMDANIVTVQAPNGTLIFQTDYNRSTIHPENLPFSAYAPAGKVKTDNVVYANYGRRQDFESLENLNVSVNGSLLIIRYGQIHPASKVRNAERHGALGVILYSDPADFANNQSSGYPTTWWLPSWAVRLSHVRYELEGDPLTPDYSSITGIHNIAKSEAKFPKIPVQPIRYSDAKYLLSEMDGAIVSNSWFGGLNITYKTGPGYTDKRKVTLTVENIIQHRDISNIIAVIQGHFETDKYVIVGAHIDSWIQGAVDSGTGYTIMQELSRTFAYHIGKGWRPRRTIMFALWDASKYGHVGSYEWVQEYGKQLIAGAVAYINLDAIIQGNFSFSAAASSMLHSVIMDAARTVIWNCSFCDRQSDNSANISVFEDWTSKFPDPKNNSRPNFEVLGDDSDHGPFIYRLGIPSASPYFTYNKKMFPRLSTYPTYGTMDDNIEYVQRFIDPDFSLHIMMTKIMADVILRLSDSAIVPLDILNLVGLVNKGKQILLGYESVLTSAGIKIELLFYYSEIFCDAAQAFDAKIKSLDRSKLREFDIYLINDQLLQLPKAFLSDKGLPGQSHYRNLLVAPDLDNLHEEIVFPGVTRILIEGPASEHWAKLGEQVSYLILCLKRATDILQSGLTS